MSILFPLQITSSQIDQFKDQAYVFSELIHILKGERIIKGNVALNRYASSWGYASFNQLLNSAKGITLSKKAPQTLSFCEGAIPTMASNVAEYTSDVNIEEAVLVLSTLRVLIDRNGFHKKKLSDRSLVTGEVSTELLDKLIPLLEEARVEEGKQKQYMELVLGVPTTLSGEFIRQRKDAYFEELSEFVDIENVRILNQELSTLELNAPEVWCQNMAFDHSISQGRAAEFLLDKFGIKVELLPEPEMFMRIEDSEGNDITEQVLGVEDGIE